MSYPVILGSVGNHLAEEIDDELFHARQKFPQNKHLTVALLEEVGELAQAQLQGKPVAEIRQEAIQEGDADLAGATEGAG